ncbi:MAG: PP2C family protein-serine/threonine phosphatase, partial [bacterium]|nr:PP2C family protein-serine/threonine phosphatase [bacterium]
RRKYDYYNVLSELGEKIGTELDLPVLLNKLFRELKDIFYVQHILVLVKVPEPNRSGFREVGSVAGNREKTGQETVQAVMLDDGSGLYQWLKRNKRSVLKDEVKVNPDFERIREECLSFLEWHDLDILVPLILESETIGTIGLGKKGTLQNYTIRDIDLLEQLGRQIGITIDNALHHADIIEKERMAEEFKLGRQIQSALLPRSVPVVKGLKVSGMMEVAKEIGGDYYDFIPLSGEDNLAVVIGGVSGKGLVPGLFMAMVKAAIHIFSEKERSPKNILLNVNEIFNQHVGQDKFVTMLYLIWQAQKSMITFSSAGSEKILIYRAREGEVEMIQPGGMILGIVPDIGKMLEEKEINLKTGDKMLLYTDGVVEAHNSSGERFGPDRLKDSFMRYNQKAGEALISSIRDEIYSFIHPSGQKDDFTLVVLEAGE